MKVFVWKRVQQTTDNYHSEGGLVVFSDSIERARQMANKAAGVLLRDDEHPDEVRECEGGEAIYIMPDAGCC